MWQIQLIGEVYVAVRSSNRVTFLQQFLVCCYEITQFLIGTTILLKYRKMVNHITICLECVFTQRQTILVVNAPQASLNLLNEFGAFIEIILFFPFKVVGQLLKAAYLLNRKEVVDIQYSIYLRDK